MLEPYPVGHSNRTVTCYCGATVDLFTGAHPPETCPAVQALLNPPSLAWLRWFAERQVAAYEHAQERQELNGDDQAIDQVLPRLVFFEDEYGQNICDPFHDITAESEVNPLTYYGLHFANSPFIPLARALALAAGGAMPDAAQGGPALWIDS